MLGSRRNVEETAEQELRINPRLREIMEQAEGELFNQDISGRHKGVKDCNEQRAEGEAIATCRVVAEQKADEIKKYVRDLWITDLKFDKKSGKRWDCARWCTGKWTAVCHFELVDIRDRSVAIEMPDFEDAPSYESEESSETGS